MRWMAEFKHRDRPRSGRIWWTTQLVVAPSAGEARRDAREIALSLGAKLTRVWGLDKGAAIARAEGRG